MRLLARVKLVTLSIGKSMDVEYEVIRRFSYCYVRVNDETLVRFSTSTNRFPLQSVNNEKSQVSTIALTSSIGFLFPSSHGTGVILIHWTSCYFWNACIRTPSVAHLLIFFPTFHWSLCYQDLIETDMYWGHYIEFCQRWCSITTDRYGIVFKIIA